MTTITDQSTINAIQDAYNAGRWQDAYQLVFNAITTVTVTEDPQSPTSTTRYDPNSRVDIAVWTWIAGAQRVNSKLR